MRRTILRGPLMRAATLIALGLLAVAVFGFGATAANNPGFKTANRPYLAPLEPGVLVDPILSTGDIVGGYQMSGIPDGLGAYKDSGNVQLLMNHELGKTFPGNPSGVDARISKVTLDNRSHGVLSATYLFNGSEGFERFCSATLESINGTPYYFTGEEAVAAGHDGSSIVMNAETGQWTETPQFGHIQHENIVPVERIKKFMLVTTRRRLPSWQPVAAARLHRRLVRRRGLGRSCSRKPLCVEGAGRCRHAGVDHRG
jgi:hypothetical protein